MTEVSAGFENDCQNRQVDPLLAIRKTLHFYNEHLRSSTSSPPQMILLSDDRKNRELAQSDGLIAISTRDYVDGLVAEEREKLVDLVVGGVDEVSSSERRAKKIYQDVCWIPSGCVAWYWLTVQYLPQDVLTAGVKSGRYFQGHYNANPYNYLEVSGPSSCILTGPDCLGHCSCGFAEQTCLAGRAGVDESVSRR